MTLEEYTKACAVLQEHANIIVQQKRPDYTQESRDVLQNFKDAARDAGIDPLQAWLVHFQKQYSAVARFIKNPNCSPSEPIEGRFADLYNYLFLGFGLFYERTTSSNNTLCQSPATPGSKSGVHDYPNTSRGG